MYRYILITILMTVFLPVTILSKNVEKDYFNLVSQYR